MSVTVTTIDSQEMEGRVVHKDGQTFSATTEGLLYVFDYTPKSPEHSAQVSTLAHTVAVYAPGRWVKAVQS